jgi:hypothetical protein
VILRPVSTVPAVPIVPPLGSVHHGDQSVPIVPAVQSLRAVQSVAGSKRVKVPSLTAVQSSKVQRSMTTPRQTVPGFREFS